MDERMKKDPTDSSLPQVWLKKEELPSFLIDYNGIIKKAIIERNINNSVKTILGGMGNILKTVFFVSTINIPITIAILFCIVNCHSFFQSGYEAGIKNSKEKAKKEAAANYEPQIIDLKSELNIITDEYKKTINRMQNGHSAKLDSMQGSHLAQLDSIENDYIGKINFMENNHMAKMNTMQCDYEAEISTIQSAHQVELKKTKESSYRNGQRAMKSRIDAMFNLEVENTAVRFK
ncbi:hypothetical protein LQZ21_01550 [Treponema sp. TIM-1]|uniref:hypothetical protein n=1 Tax=Treponema sp. TIM-1 TaxID=2898417 RepID=UPI0039813D1D